MTYYTCSNADCETDGDSFSLTSSGQTFCPRCGTSGALTAAAPPAIDPVSLTRVLQSSNTMAVCPNKKAAEVETLIAKWDLNLVSTEEANSTHDCVFKLGKDRRKRIDREGPVTSSSDNTVTHAKFRLQFNSDTYAGVWIKVDEVLSLAKIRQAFRESLNSKLYVEVYLG